MDNKPELHAHDHEHHHHDHDHDHHHEDHHDHDHHHEDHEHGGSEGISISRHEESLIGVFSNSLPEPYHQALGIVEAKMKAMAEAVVQQGGVIGHIKSLVTAEGDRCMISITDTELGPQKRFLGGNTARFEVVVIVFGIDEAALQEIIRSAFLEYINKQF